MERDVSIRNLLHRLDTKLIAGLLSALLVVGVPFFAFFYNFHRNQLIEGLQSSTSSLSRLIVGSLESAMAQQAPHLLQEEVAVLSQQSGVERIMLLDHDGQVRVSSDPRLLGVRLDAARDPTCQVCHDLDRQARQSTTIAQAPEGEVFRNMTAIKNDVRCHPCHSPRERINGILILDLSLEPVRERLSASFHRMLALGGTMALLTVLALGVLLRKLVLNRLRRFMKVTTLIGKGRLDASVPVDSHDELGVLAESFNATTASLRNSLEELKTQREFLEDVMNSIRDEIVVFDRNGDVVRANDAGRDRGCSPLVAETFRSGSPASGIQNLEGRDGHEITLELATYPLLDNNGEVFQVIQVARDITERRCLEARLHHSDRLASLGLLASGVSHEINNPLGSVSTGIEGLIRMSSDSQISSEQLTEMRDYLQIIRGELDRASSITRRLLALAQPCGRTTSVIDVGEALSDTVGLVRYRARQSGTEILEAPNGTSHLVKGDESSLRQIFLNLLLNALEAVESDGVIEVAVRPVQGGLEVSVRDNGRGIAREDLSKIFEPFFSKKNGRKGTGLGLFIARALVDDFGGHIHVESVPEQGTEFKVFLPQHRELPS